MYSRVFNLLLDHFQENPSAILQTGYTGLVNIGVGESLARLISQAGRGLPEEKIQTAVDHALSWQEHPANRILTRCCPDYPALLKEIDDPPPVLYVRGTVNNLHLPMVAMVGSRHPSADGRRHAWRFAKEFAEGGIGVSSGMARGIDTESHRGALAGKGFTIAVLGCGIDQVYPASNRNLAEDIAGQGALITEFNPGTAPLPSHFPRRNRIISGMSLGVVVIEAGMKSGTLITARCALEQGREVYAMPGSVNNPMARGCHSLINQGARLVQSPRDVVEDNQALLDRFREQSVHQPERSPGGQASVDTRTLTVTARTLLGKIGFEPVPVDVLIQETGLDASVVTATLVDLEIQGLVSEHAGCYMRPVRD